MRRRITILGALLLLLVGVLLLFTSSDPRPGDSPAPPDEDGTRAAAAPEAGAPREIADEEDAVERPEPPNPREGRPIDRPPGPRGFFPDLSGRVVDVDTGKPVRGARVIYGTPDMGWWGDDADDEGAFDYKIPRRPRNPETPFRLRVLARGYEPWEGTPEEAKVAVELRPLSRPGAPGRIRGRAEDVDGRPLTGVVQVVIGDEGNNLLWLDVLADEHGEFLLDGVEPGPWRISIYGGGDGVRVYVPSDGEAPVTIRAGRPVKRAFGDADSRRLAELEKEIEQTHHIMADLRAKGATAETLELTERRLHELIHKASKLETAKRATAARREVRITGLAGKDGEILVAEHYGSSSIERWRATVREGAARYPGLLAGTWHLHVVGESKKVAVKVPEGSGAARVPFPR